MLRPAVSLLALLLLVVPARAAEKPEDTYRFALQAYRDGLYETSAEAFREYLASPTSKAHRAEANFFLGQALLALGNDAEGLAALEAAARADAKARVAPLARLLRTQRFLDRARYKEAQAEADRWLRYFSRHSLRWEVQVLRGRALAGRKRWDEAAAVFQKVARAEKAPEGVSLDALSSLAEVRSRKGRPKQAAEAWAALIKRAPDDPRAAQARLQLATQAVRAGRFDEALGQVKAILKTHPEAPEAGPARLIRADSLFGLERFSQAADAYHEAARDEGAGAFSPAHWERAGLAAYRVERFEEAAEALSKAGDGLEGANLAVRIRALRKAGDPAEIMKASSRLLSKYPRSPWAAEVLWPTVELARSSGMWEEARGALAAFGRGAAADQAVEARYGLAHVELYGGRPAEAARLFEAVARVEGGLDRYPDVRYKRAVALAAAGRHRAALELVEDVSQRERIAVGAEAVLVLEADVHRALEHYGTAADRYQALLAQKPEAEDSGQWLLALAEVEEARGRPTEALGAYRRWLESHPGDPAASSVRLATARLLAASGRREEALAHLEAVGAGDDKHLAAQAFLVQGRIAFEQQDYEAALAASGKAAEGLPAASPAHALARWRMARALEQTGRPADAAAHYRWLAEHAEDDEVRKASRQGLARVTAKANEAKKAP